ncbi:2OG-Fe(II) oxygenase [Pendulispora albinea]|uniref:2OG-Fe(II) oxygenase n=1 Tax=Pendulispora albinea TaxID=2741071 RepID=A0ABZ2M1F1_9BACT
MKRAALDAASRLLLTGVSRSDTPFSHFTVEHVFTPDLALSLLEWLEETDQWHLKTAEHFRMFSFFPSEESAPLHLRDVFTPSFGAVLRNRLEDLFCTRFDERFFIAANKHSQGHGTSIHNDYAALGKQERYFFTHRFLVYLIRDWDVSAGGSLGLFTSPDSTVPYRTIPPLHNTGVGMVMGKKSFHALDPVNAGDRYSLTISLVSATGDYEES